MQLPLILSCRLSLPILALAIFMGFAPYLAAQAGWVSAYDGTRLLQLILLMLGASSLCPWIAPRRALTAYAAGALLLLLALSTAQSANAAMAAREVLLLGALALLALQVAAAPARVRNALALWAGASVALYALPVLAMMAIGLSQQVPWHPDAALPGYDNRRAFNHVQTAALPLALWAAAWAPKRSLRAIAGAGLTASMALLWITLGRGTLLGLIGAALVLLAGARVDRRVALQSLFVLVAAGLLGALLAASVLNAAVGLQTGKAAAAALTGDSSRFALWREAARMATDSPWLGAGPMHFALGVHEKAAHPHSLPLQIAAEWGLPALVLVACIAWLGLKAMLRAWRRAPTAAKPLGLCLLAAWAAVGIDSFFSGLWVMPMSQVWLTLLIGLSVGWLRDQVMPTATSAQRLAWLPLLVSGTLLLLCWPEVRRLPDHLAEQRAAFPSEGNHPRFWSHGHFGPR